MNRASYTGQQVNENQGSSLFSDLVEELNQQRGSALLAM